MDVKTERPGIFRTPDGYLVNKDVASLQAYRARKKHNKKIDEVESEVVQIKNDLMEIKTMLKEFLHR
jgi:hypothetical protein